MSEATHPLMTAAEVAADLRVAERTVYNWASKGILPGAKIGSTWRFRRPEVVEWFNRKFDEGADSGTLHLRDVLDRERVVFLDAPDKATVLEALIDRLATTPEVTDRQAFADGILRRERMMSTGIGLGIGLPHVRLDSVTAPVMAVAKCLQPLTDYESLDSEPVRVVFMIGAAPQQHAHHLALLSGISRRMKSAEFRQLLMTTEEPGDFYDVLLRGRS